MCADRGDLDVQVRLTIGDFARMTHLSVKALRHYHDQGLLVPADIDRWTGYRYYDPSQVATAQVIRRFRDMGMPLGDLRSVLQAPDVSSRNRAIVTHLQRMERQLEQTQSTVASLRALLEGHPRAPIEVELRRVGPTRALAIREEVSVAGAVTWWEQVFKELRSALHGSGAERTGPDGALWPGEFFEVEKGQVTAFLPVSGGAQPSGRMQVLDIPAGELAVTLHEGPFEDLDQAYAALGMYVAEHVIGVEGPIREHYLVTPFDTRDESRHRTEVCWPVFLTT